MSVLDDQNFINQRDPQHALQIALSEADQLQAIAQTFNLPADTWLVQNIVIAGMGGSALAAGIAKSWLDLLTPLEIIRKYDVPKYVDGKSLFIASSYSGNTEETLSALTQAEVRGAKIAVIAAGGKLLDIAKAKNYPYVRLVSGLQPRMAVFYNLKALVAILEQVVGLAIGCQKEIADQAEWLSGELRNWTAAVPEEQNYAKQLAQKLVGKTPVVYAGSLMAPIAYKWKISFNENSKNLSFWNEFPEFSHNEFMGWSSHPIEKPFAVIDLLSNHEHPQILRRFEITDRLLSGMRPKSIVVNIGGMTVLQQMLWGANLADFVSIYLAILNGVNPTPVDLIEKLKLQL